MGFRISGLSAESFRPFFGLGDDALMARRAVRQIADEKPGFPCRITLSDAEPGEPVLLLNHAHQTAQSPYAASGPIYVREGALDTAVVTDRVPEMLAARLLSVRAYDKAGMIVDADVTEGRDLGPLIDRFFEAPEVAYLHVHFARRGCYAARVDRA